MMGFSSYVPGDWTGVVSEGFLAVLGPDTPQVTAERLWAGAQDKMSFIDGLSMLAAEGFGAMQPFALAVAGADGVTHVAVRGDVVVDAQVGADAVTIDGHGVATWTERSLGGVQAMAIRVPGVGDGPDLPLVAGVVRMSGLRSPHGATIGSAEESSADSEEPAPAPVVEQAPAAVHVEPVAVYEADVADTDETDLTLVGQLDPVEVEDDATDSYTIMSSTMAEVRQDVPEWTGESDPSVAQLVLSTGLVVALDRPVLLGRAPQAARVSSQEMPRLVAVPSPQQDISRTHAEVRVEGDDVLVTDLDSTNGVHVLRPGRGARRLRPGEPRALAPDETIDLGDGVTFVVERMQ